MMNTEKRGFASFISLHNLVNTASSDKIKKIANGLSGDLLKHILLIYTKYFFSLSNRNQYFNDNKTDDNIVSIENSQSKFCQISHEQILSFLETKLYEKGKKSGNDHTSTQQTLSTRDVTQKDTETDDKLQNIYNQLTNMNDIDYYDIYTNDNIDEQKYCHSSSFQKLDKLLISHILSFNACDERLKASQTCHLLFSAANEQIAKYHLKINKSLVYNVLIHDNIINNKFDVAQYKNFRSIHLASLYNGADKKKRINFIKNMKQILYQSCNTLINFECEIDRQYSNDTINKIQGYLTNIISLKMHNQRFKRKIFNNLKELHVTQKIDMEDIQHLWINEEYASSIQSYSHSYSTNASNSTNDVPIDDHETGNNERDEIQIENGDIDIACYVLPEINYSCLTHLILNVDNFNLSDIRSGGVIAPHPFFWLWNISTLQYCSLNMTLPVAKVRGILIYISSVECLRNERLSQIAICALFTTPTFFIAFICRFLFESVLIYTKF